MADVARPRLWLRRLLFVGVFFGLALAALLPLMDYRPWQMSVLFWSFSLPAGTMAPPDVTLALTCAWVARRPDLVPIWILAPLFLISDFLFLRPPGLWSAIAIIGTEVLRSRVPSLRAAGFGAEWLAVAITLAAMALGYRLALLVTVVPAPPLGLVVSELVFTVLVYPVVAGICHLLFGVRRVAPGEVDSLGHRL